MLTCNPILDVLIPHYNKNRKDATYKLGDRLQWKMYPSHIGEVVAVLPGDKYIVARGTSGWLLFKSEVRCLLRK